MKNIHLSTTRTHVILGRMAISDISHYCISPCIYIHISTMADSMTLALEHKINNPRERYQKVAVLYEVSKSSLYDRHTGVHSSHTISTPRHLSIVQEGGLVKKINRYAERSTLLIPRHALEFAEAVYGGEMGVKSGSQFIQRPCNTIHSRFFSYKELGRLQADIPEIRRAF